MQNRMKTHALDTAQIEALLDKAQTATLATLHSDGTPYVTPIHFLYAQGHIYFHGLPQGEKIENLRLHPAVSLCAYAMEGFLIGESGIPCDVNTKYHSVIVQGTAREMTDTAEKEAILRKIAGKYAPQALQAAIPPNALSRTAVVCIDISQCTGKYYA